jgi:hypothetical protein
MNKPLFQIIFIDDSIFEGGDYQMTKWLEIPNKKIRTLFYLLPTGDYLGLSGYNKFYHFVEVTEDLSGDRKGIKNIEFDYIIGQRINSTTIYKINFKLGNVEIKEVKNDDIFLKNLNPIGWR